jgi:hypothetical protein
MANERRDHIGKLGIDPDQDLALFKRRDKDAIRSTRQQAGEIGLAHRQRQLAQIVTVQESKASLVYFDLEDEG